MSENKLVAEARTQFGKGAARKIRRDHLVPLFDADSQKFGS